MKTFANPFVVTGYQGPDFFCDRKEETSRLIKNITNGVNTTIYSIRRMGKTGVILHTFNELAITRLHCIYVDIYATQNLKEFTDQLANGILKAFPEKHSLGKKFMDFLKSLRPVLSFDSLTGLPEVSFDFTDSRQYETSITGLMTFVEKQGVPVILAIDEFQQILQYPEKNTEALLRSIIQKLKNIHFIFCGSSKHLLTAIFADSKRPFFSSTRPMHLDVIEKKEYRNFIRQHFIKSKRKIDDDAIGFILEWTRQHTYYTQVVCNTLFASEIQHITIDIVKDYCKTILDEQEDVFFQYRNLLTPAQWSLLTAIAKDDKLYQPSAKKFLSKHDLSTSGVQRALPALFDKELVYLEQDAKGSYYRVYDCFLARWLERL